MRYYEVTYRDVKFDITFDLKFSIDEMFIYLEDSEVDIEMILNDEVKGRIEDYINENYHHYFEEMERDAFNEMMYLIRNKKI